VEVEVKIRVEHRRFLALLGEAGYSPSLSGPVLQEDTFFDWPDLRLLRSGSALRVRREDGSVLITFKGPRSRGPEKRRVEVEGPLGSPEAAEALRLAGLEVPSPPLSPAALEELLLSRGLKPILTVRKERRTAVLENGLRLALDRVAGLGEFVEVEGEGALEFVRSIGLLDLAVEETYAELLLAKEGLDSPLLE